jgi:hypothetical protein
VLDQFSLNDRGFWFGQGDRERLSSDRRSVPAATPHQQSEDMTGPTIKRNTAK